MKGRTGTQAANGKGFKRVPSLARPKGKLPPAVTKIPRRAGEPQRRK